jgi:hypothetical protein
MSQTARAQLDQPLLDLEGIDLSGASRLTYVLRQCFRYEYEGRVYALRQRLVVLPPGARRQPAPGGAHQHLSPQPRTALAVNSLARISIGPAMAAPGSGDTATKPSR